MLRSLILCIAIAAVALCSSCESKKTALQKAAQFARAGKYEEAALQYRKAIQRDPASDEAYYRLALLRIENADIAAAMPALRQAAALEKNTDRAKIALGDLLVSAYASAGTTEQHAIYRELTGVSDRLCARDPRSFDGLRFRGYLAMADHNPAAAEVYFRKADQIRAAQPEILLALSQALFQRNRAAEGEQIAKELIRKYPRFGPAYDALYIHYIAQPADPRAAELVLQHKVANNPGVSDYVFQLAGHYRRTGRMADADLLITSLMADWRRFPEIFERASSFYVESGAYDKALAVLARAEKQDPQRAAQYACRRADVLMTQGNTLDALRTVHDILEKFPDNVRARAIRAILLVDSQKDSEVEYAIRELQTLSEKNGSDAVLHFHLGRAYLKRGKIADARAQLQEAIRLQSNNTSARLLLAGMSLEEGRYRDAVRQSGAVLSSTESPIARLLGASALLGLNAYTDARSELNQVRKLWPGMVEAQLELAYVDLAEKKFASAEAAFKKLYRPESGDTRPLAGLVEAYTAEGKVDAALDLLQNESARNPRARDVRSLLAETAFRAKRRDLAIAQYRFLVSNGDPQVSERMRLAELYDVDGNVPAAISQAETAVKTSPGSVLARFVYAYMLEESGNLGAAEDGYRQVLQLQPDHVLAMNNLACVLAGQGKNLDEAHQLIERALQRAPQNPEFMDTLASVYLKQGYASPAQHILSSLVQKNPDNPLYRAHLAAAWLQAGDRQRAVSELTRAEALHPRHQTALVIASLRSKVNERTVSGR